MNIQIREINENNILKFLHYRGSQIPDDLENLIEDSANFIRENFLGKYSYKLFSIEDESLAPILIGNDIKELLATSSHVILMGLTLGQEVERHIRKLTYTDLTKSVIMDAVASAAVESLAEDINVKLADEFRPRYLTDRFSPGYGDMPIEIQGSFLDLLNAGKEIGLTTSSSGIMLPRKSISAIIGVSDKKQAYRHRGCATCRLYKECDFIKRGVTCAYEK